MNIAIDVLAILGPDSKNRGIGNYSVSQFKTLFELDKENKYFLLNFYENTSLKEMLHYGDNVKEYYFSAGPGNFLIGDPSFKAVLGNIIKKFIYEHQIEEFYITSPFDNNLYFEMEWFTGTRTIATVYDIIPYLFKKRYLSDKLYYNKYMEKANKLKYFDKLLVISKSVKEDLINSFDIESDKIEVILAGVDQCYEEIPIGTKEKTLLEKKYGITDQFIMCTGGDDDRKNIAGLIEAFSNLPRQVVDQYQLVVACKLSKDSEQRYFDLAKQNGIDGRLVLTNFVPLEHLIILYNTATVMAFPSQYEGFGLPVVEAMACATPVLTSNNSSLGEIAKGAAVLVDPFSIKDVTRGLLEILTNTDLNLLIEKGKKRVELFTWSSVANITLQAINELTQTAKKKEDLKIEDVKKAIAFFTPLPPLQSGIADYSLDIINELTKYFSIDVYVDDVYNVDSDLLNPEVEVYSHQLFNKNQNKYTDIIYQMGNSEFHFYMIHYIQNYPGTVVLHDYNLHGLMYNQVAEKGDFNSYRKFLYEDYDKEFVDNYIHDLQEGRTPLKTMELPSNGMVANYAKKIIVHSDYAKKGLLIKDIKRNVKKILSYANIESIKDKNVARKELNVKEEGTIIAAFGHIHETKRIMPALKAFEKLCEDNLDLRFYLVGAPAEHIKKELTRFIVDTGLQDKIIITGYTDLVTFEKFIDATDICMNLRYPYNGETSGSLMRILSKGKVAVINNIGSFSEIPDNCCVKLSSPEFLSEDQEVEMIYNGIFPLLSQPQRIEEIGCNARRYAQEELDINLIGLEYSKFINNTLSPSINEEIVDRIVKIISASEEFKDEEIYTFSKTLAYAKNTL